ncbi:MAG: tetratricopeptide repeat protein [Limnospira sp.]
MALSSRRVPIFSPEVATIKHQIARRQARWSRPVSLATVPILLSIATTTLGPTPPAFGSDSRIVAQAISESDAALRDRVQTEVDSAFRRTLALLNLILVFLFLLPTIAGVGVWFLLSKLTHQVFEVRQEIDSLKSDTIAQIEESLREAKTLLRQLQKNATRADEAIASLKVQTILQLPESEAEESPETEAEPAPAAQTPEPTSEKPEEPETPIPQPTQPQPPGGDRILEAARQFAKQGEKFFMENRLDEAINAYDQALKLQANLPEVWNNRGVVLTRLKRYQEAIASYEQAIQIRADYPDAWSNRGVALAKLKYYEAAVFSYDRAIQLKEDYLDAWNNRGQALMNLQQYDEAIASFNNAAKIRPDFYRTWYNKARCYALKDNRELAIENLRRALRIDAKLVKNFIKKEKDFDNIRQDKKFQELLD